MRLTELHRRARHPSLLLEMNVLNTSAFSAAVDEMIYMALSNRHATLANDVVDLLVKRLTRAAVNDDAGTMVTSTPIDPKRIPPDAPAWVQAAIAKKQQVVIITPKPDLADKMAHIVDWLIADADPMEAIRTQPEKNLIDNLYAQADRFFAAQNMRLMVGEDEGGREVVMTFRKGPNQTDIHHYTESTLEPDERGPVIAFWCKLTTPSALNREGKLMQHCVGNYADAVAHHRTTIYSLRDAANKPHVTVEASMSWDTTTGEQRIQQIKGKQNQPPLGKYRPFVKVFMNELGLKASEHGARDARAVGLINQGQRYGEYHEVARLLHEFPSGAKLMTLHEGQAPALKSGWGGSQTHENIETVYLLPDHSIALELAFNFPPDAEITFNGAVLRQVIIRRNTPRLFPRIADDLLSLLHLHVRGNGSPSLERLGIFHDERVGMADTWGRLPDVAEKRTEANGLTAYALKKRVLIVESDTLAPVASIETGGSVNSLVFKITTEAENPNGSKLPALLLQYARDNEDGKHRDPETGRMWRLSDYPGTREQLRQFGLIYVSAKTGWQLVGDVAKATEAKAAKKGEDSAVRRSEYGSIVLYQQRWFFLDPEGNFLGMHPNPTYAFSREAGGNGPVVKSLELHWNTTSDGEKLLRLLASVQDQGTHPIILEGFSGGRIADAGWALRNGRLRHKSEIEGVRRLSNGASASLELVNNGAARFTINGRDWTADNYVDGEGLLSPSRQFIEACSTSGRPATLAEALNAFHLAVKRDEIMNLRLSFRNGHFVGLDPEADKDIIDYHDVNKGYHSPQGWIMRVHRKNGYIEDASGNALATFSLNDDEFSVSMRKHRPDGWTRQDVVRAVAEAMHWWHDRIEPVYHDGPAIYRVAHGGAH